VAFGRDLKRACVYMCTW